jgi:tetratricopeptide (TPR) repeat protein
MIEAHIDADPYNYARTLIALGKAHVHLGDHPNALHHLSKGRDLMEQYGSEYRLAEVWTLLGQIAEASDDLAAAEEHYQNALGVYIALDALETPTIKERIKDLHTKKERS